MYFNTQLPPKIDDNRYERGTGTELENDIMSGETTVTVGPYNVIPSELNGTSKSAGYVSGGDYDGEYIGSCESFSGMSPIYGFQMSKEEAQEIRTQFKLNRQALHLNKEISEEKFGEDYFTGQYCITTNLGLITKISSELDCKNFKEGRCDEIKKELKRISDPTGAQAASDSWIHKNPVLALIFGGTVSAVAFVGVMKMLDVAIPAISEHIKISRMADSILEGAKARGYEINPAAKKKLVRYIKSAKDAQKMGGDFLKGVKEWFEKNFRGPDDPTSSGGSSKGNGSAESKTASPKSLQQPQRFSAAAPRISTVGDSAKAMIMETAARQAAIVDLPAVRLPSMPKVMTAKPVPVRVPVRASYAGAGAGALNVIGFGLQLFVFAADNYGVDGKGYKTIEEDAGFLDKVGEFFRAMDQGADRFMFGPRPGDWDYIPKHQRMMLDMI